MPVAIWKKQEVDFTPTSTLPEQIQVLEIPVAEVKTEEVSESTSYLTEEQYNLLSLDDQYLFDERAGIMEYDGGLSRADAEKESYRMFLNRNQTDEINEYLFSFGAMEVTDEKLLQELNFQDKKRA